MTENLPAQTQIKELVYNMKNGDEMRLTIVMVKAYLVQGHPEWVTDREAFYFMHECKARKLNPFLRECWLIKYSQKENAQIVEAIHHKRSKARCATDCNGWEKGLILLTKDGKEKRTKGLVLEGEKVVGAYFTATPEGWKVPYELEINLKGYIKRTRDGKITQFWAEEKQPSQLMKVVESQGLSALWGDAVGKNYIPEELPGPTAIDMTLTPEGSYDKADEVTEHEGFDGLASAILLHTQTPAITDAEFIEFTAITAKRNDITILELKENAFEKFDEFWDTFELWIKQKADASMDGAGKEPDKRKGHQGGSTPQKGTDERIPCEYCETLCLPGRGMNKHMNNYCTKYPDGKAFAPPIEGQETGDGKEPGDDQGPIDLTQEEIENCQSNYPNIHPRLFETPEFNTLSDLLKSERARVVWNKPTGWCSTDITDTETLTKAFGQIVKQASRVTLGNHEG